MTLAAVLALLTSGLFGTSDFLAGALSRRLPGPAVALWSQLAGGAVLLVLVVLSGQGFSGSGAAWGAMAGIVAAAGILVFYRAMSLGSTSIVASIAAGGVALPVIWGIVGGETPSPVGIFGIFVVVVGLALLSLAGSPGKEIPAVRPPCPPPRPRVRAVARIAADGQSPSQLAVPLALLAAACFGAFFILVDRGTAAAGDGVLWVSVGVQVGAVLTTTGFAAFSGLRAAVGVASPGLLLPVALIGLLELGADIALIYATALGQLSVVSVLASLSALVTAVLSRFLLAERLSRLGVAGVALSLVGVVLISV
ncbi:MAG: hypothetical protein AVDCRST_MAG12-3062 [uncultured Rubrobacteraceae bacterium]|uniref:EamA domain-containing protein n=1 Tax=uncultured Rubrobacteraceae bacterium TaxID=349277 RepID=A0A6J4SXR1_9ACTN|nr:MAG: hypothetical protein AVDCRST_MAG12-3062 [uncultured Rubrobacteraceae bacterium]